MSRDKSFFFVKKGDLVKKYDMCLNTFNKELALIKDRLPLYRDKQRLFTPAQVKMIDELWCGS